MSRSKKAQLNACLIIVLLIVIVVALTLFLSKGYREYLKNYDDFQEYLAQKEALEEGASAGNENITGDVSGEGTEGSDQTADQGSVSDNSMSASSNQPEFSDGNTGEVTSEQPGAPLSGSKEIADVSGNVLWQANTVTAEEAALIRGYIEERNQVYTWANSYEKTMKINELDKLILQTASCTFPNITINFVGDSITEGVGGAVDANGNKISYVNYVQEALQFGSVINNGLAGRMIAAYTLNTGLSMQENGDGLFTKDAEITVFYVGLNDYLAPEETKNFGVIDNGTTGGYCGQLQNWVHSFPKNYPNTDFFFVTAYQTPIENPTQNNTNFNGVPNLNDYMEPQRQLAAQYDYPVIELYGTGFMDMNDPVTAQNLMSDSLHPNDAGYRVLGEHIAAEIVVYYLGMTQ